MCNNNLIFAPRKTEKGRERRWKLKGKWRKQPERERAREKKKREGKTSPLYALLSLMIISFSRSVFPSNAHTRSHPHQRSLLIILGKSRILNLLNIRTHFFSLPIHSSRCRKSGRVREVEGELCMRVDWETRAEGADLRVRDCVQALPPISRRVNITKKNRSFQISFEKFRLHLSKFASSLRHFGKSEEKKKKIDEKWFQSLFVDESFAR